MPVFVVPNQGGLRAVILDRELGVGCLQVDDFPGNGEIVCRRFRASAEEQRGRQCWQSSSPVSKKGFRGVRV